MAKRTYNTDQITVNWDSDKCIKCGNCHEQLPEVFQPDERPWIKIDAAPAEKIKEIVRECPTQAISL